MNKEKFCFVIDRKSSISFSLFSNTFSKKNTYSFYHALLPIKSVFSKIYNKVMRFLDKFIIPRKVLAKKKFNDKIVFFTNESLNGLDKEIILDIKTKAKATVLFFIDELFNDYESMSTAKKMISDKDKIFDLVYTFSPKDAEKYNLLKTMNYYHCLELKHDKIIPRVFFVGNIKRRKEFLSDLSFLFDKKGVDYHFVIDGLKENVFKKWKRGRISYYKNIKNVYSSNVILDMADERQTGMTLRYYEAVCYNKKLLTNNANIINMPYYDEKYMKVYKTVGDVEKIDKSWFTAVENIDYGYKCEFEPKYFLEQIEKDLIKRVDKN